MTRLELCEDAIELCIDITHSTRLRDVARCIATMRRYVDAEIIYSIDTSQANVHLSDDQLTELLLHSLRLTVEYIAVDLGKSDNVLHAITRNKALTRLIGHMHLPTIYENGWLGPSRIALLQRTQHLSFVIIRLTQEAFSREDNDDVVRFRHEARLLGTDSPVTVAYNLGSLGRTSLTTNCVLTPVDARYFPINTDPSRTDGFDILSATTALYHSYQYDRLNYIIVGNNALQSRTPPMHMAAYRVHGLLHSFRPLATASFENALAAWHQPDFGGSAVSYPYKEKAYRACLESSHHASAIGSVNTILPLWRHAKTPEEAALVRNTAGEVIGLYGDNSDWYGVYVCLRRAMSPWHAANISEATALVLGAGGTARSAVYALLQAGCRSIYVRNRTQSNAERIAEHFNSWAYSNLNISSEVVRCLPAEIMEWPVGYHSPAVVVSCIPASQLNYGLVLPPQWLANIHGGVAVDVSGLTYVAPNRYHR